jgi:hypothetical protein
VKETKHKNKKVSVDCRRLKRFGVISVGGGEKLITPVKGEGAAVLYHLNAEEIFDVVHNTHLKIGQGGRTRMEKELTRKYKNVTKEIILTYLNLCKQCEAKKSMPRKGSVSKPMIFRELNSRCQVDLVDMQSCADGEYKFITNYQDHLTKFVFLRPLKTKKAEDVAYNLVDIFTITGAPSVLQSDNGREFANRIFDELTECGQS